MTDNALADRAEVNTEPMLNRTDEIVIAGKRVMTRILVAEDSRTQAVEIEILLQDAGFDVHVVENGRRALETIQECGADVLLTDLHMPEMNGLELVEAVRKNFPKIPVVMMTADGTEDIAAQALKAGAASYLPKRQLEADLVITIKEVVDVLKARRNEDRVTGAIVSSDVFYRLSNDHDLAAALVARLEQQMRELKLADETDVFRMALSLKEALLNAIDHGNLELDSKLREDMATERYHELGEQRMREEPYASRTVTVRALLSDDEIRYVITDQGPGFDPATIPDPRDPENLLRPHGRGLMLILSFMDEVLHNDMGNEITLVKRRPRDQQEGRQSV